MTRYLIVVFVFGCAPTRFADRGVLWHDKDEDPILQPKFKVSSVHWVGLRDVAFQPADRALAIDYGVEAENVNAFDEVPDSSWFADPRRDGQGGVRPRSLTWNEMAWGAMRPEDLPVPPLVVTHGKTIGATKGFIINDARGKRFLVKLDPPGRPYFATSVEVVVSRLAWASGWRVPGEAIVTIDPRALSVAPDAKGENKYGAPNRFTDAELRDILNDLSVDKDGNMAVLVSAWLPGTPVGSFAYVGRRKDDPNDRVRHENRRELRAFGLFSSWVNNIDAFPNNTLDMYEGKPGQGHVVHYQQDVGGAFGTWSALPAAYWMGHETFFEPWHALGALLTLGFVPTPWDGQKRQLDYERRVAANTELGGFDANSFDPKKWHPVVDNPAFDRQTLRDRYWGAKKIALFSPTELRAAISAGRYPAVVADRLFEILWQRRDKVLRAWLAEVTALDYFRLDRGRLCFEDIWLEAKLGGTANYQVREQNVALAVDAADPRNSCVALPDKGGYRVIELRAKRPGQRRFGKPVKVHLGENGALRVIGIER